MLERLIHLVATAAPPIDDANVCGFVLDLDHALLAEESVFSAFKIVVTSNASCRIRIDATVADAVRELEDVERALRRVWRFGAYSYLDINSLSRWTNCTRLRFATMPSENSYCVTGSLIALGKKHVGLAQRWSKKRGRLLTENIFLRNDARRPYRCSDRAPTPPWP